MKKSLVCQICGHIEFGDLPEKCTDCGAEKDNFKDNPNAIIPAENEGQEKHVPVITVTDSCGLIPDSCRDIHIKVGSVPHPMQEDHWIQWIDCYLNSTFIARYIMLPQSIQPALGLHLKKDQNGNLTVVEHCNKHGNWMAEVTI